MTREEREAWVEQLQAENAEMLADIAERERRTLEGLDPRQWRAPQRRKTQDDEIITKDYFGAQPSLPQSEQRAVREWLRTSAIEDQTEHDQLDEHTGAIVDIIGEELGEYVRKQDGELGDRISALEERVSELEAWRNEFNNNKVVPVPFLKLRGGKNA